METCSEAESDGYVDHWRAWQYDLPRHDFDRFLRECAQPDFLTAGIDWLWSAPEPDAYCGHWGITRKDSRGLYRVTICPCGAHDQPVIIAYCERRPSWLGGAVWAPRESVALEAMIGMRTPVAEVWGGTRSPHISFGLMRFANRELLEAVRRDSARHLGGVDWREPRVAIPPGWDE